MELSLDDAYECTQRNSLLNSLFIWQKVDSFSLFLPILKSSITVLIDGRRYRTWFAFVSCTCSFFKSKKSSNTSRKITSAKARNISNQAMPANKKNLLDLTKVTIPDFFVHQWALRSESTYAVKYPLNCKGWPHLYQLSSLYTRRVCEHTKKHKTPEKYLHRISKMRSFRMCIAKQSITFFSRFDNKPQLLVVKCIWLTAKKKNIVLQPFQYFHHKIYNCADVEKQKRILFNGSNIITWIDIFN